MQNETPTPDNVASLKALVAQIEADQKRADLNRVREAERALVTNFCQSVDEALVPDDVSASASVVRGHQQHTLLLPVGNLRQLSAVLRKRIADAP